MGSMSQPGRRRTGRHEETRHEGGRRGESSSPDAPGGLPHHVPGEPAQQICHQRVVVLVVDGFPESGAALRQAASQARQRNALLDIVCIVPDGTDGPASILARVKLGEFTRRECPYGMGVQVRLRVERGDPQKVLAEVAAEAELLIDGLSRPAAADAGPETPAEVPGSATPRGTRAVLAPIPAPPA
jgi:hypothetical protein